MITSTSMKNQIETTLDGNEDDFNIEGIFDEIHEAFGLVDIDLVESEHYWAIVEKHAR